MFYDHFNNYLILFYYIMTLRFYHDFIQFRFRSQSSVFSTKMYYANGNTQCPTCDRVFDHWNPKCNENSLRQHLQVTIGL